MKRFRFLAPALLSLAAFGGMISSALAAPPAAVAEPSKAAATVTPVPRPGAWMKRHDSMNERVKKGNVDLIYVGDSITQGWEGAGKDVWAKFYGKRNAVNLGIGGDQTQHVLWRLENGNVDGIH